MPNVGRAQVAEVFAGYRSKRVWMPFYYDGQCADHLHSLGFENVVHRQVCHCHCRSNPRPPIRPLGQLPRGAPRLRGLGLGLVLGPWESPG